MMVSLELYGAALFGETHVRVRLTPQQNVPYRCGAEDFIEMSP
jgi:hypothetical protein